MKSYHDVFPFLKQGEMLISAWVAPPHHMKNVNENFNTVEQYELIKSLGLNTIYGLYENAEKHLEEVLRAINHARSQDIHYFVRDQRVKDAKDRETMIALTKAYIGADASGILVEDEPGVNGFDQLKHSFEIFRKIYQKPMFYVNLMPMHASESQLTYGAWIFDKEVEQSIDYKDYYQTYVKKLDLGYLSYDFYPFEGEFPSIRADYFDQLSYIYDLTKKYNIIPICFIQTCSFNEHVRIPTKTEILWQVNTSFAYGTKGIQYFTYFLPEQNELESFKGALIGHDGRPTHLYHDVREINQWIKMIVPYILEANIIDINHSEQKIITMFEHKDVQFKMITNTSLTNNLKIDLDQRQKIIRQNDKHDYLCPGEAILIFNKENENEENN